MDNGSEDAPPGWYPAPQGGHRYWDGRRWLALPEPDEFGASEVAGTSSTTTLSPGTKKVVVGCAIALMVLIAGGVGGVLWKNRHDTEMRNAAIASASSKAAADRAAEAAEADRVRQEADSKREQRAAAIKGIEQSVKTLAEQHIAEGIFDGPVLSVSCDPVGGGSTDDLTAKTTIFECFAATHDNGDGTMTGRKYHATMNWDSGSYTYGLGAP